MFLQNKGFAQDELPIPSKNFKLSTYFGNVKIFDRKTLEFFSSF